MPDELAVAAAGMGLGEADLTADSERPTGDLDLAAVGAHRLRKLTLISIELMRDAGGEQRLDRATAAESNSVQSRPPWTIPTGL